MCFIGQVIPQLLVLQRISVPSPAHPLTLRPRHPRMCLPIAAEGTARPAAGEEQLIREDEATRGEADDPLLLDTSNPQIGRADRNGGRADRIANQR